MRRQKFIKQPTFIISLDVELLWGHVSNPQGKIASLLSKDEKKGRGAIDILMSIFERHCIPATWAVVGHLFLDHCRKEGIPHEDMPRFRDDWYSWDPCTDINESPLFYGKDIIEKILSSPVKHEIGYHSFSHVPFSECSKEVADAEVRKGIELAEELGIKLRSFVFPRNKIGNVDILREQGFHIYRGANLAGKNVNKGLPIRAANFALSKLIAPGVEPIWRDGLWEIPSSMIFSDPFLPQTLVLRAKLGMRKAIREAKVFHIFLHPEDLLADPALSDKLDRLLASVSQKRDRGRLQVVTMGEFALALLGENGG